MSHVKEEQFPPRAHRPKTAGFDSTNFGWPCQWPGGVKQYWHCAN
jgi:hypothetical protein